MTQHLVIFEGVSGSGKTTLLMAVHRARQWEDLHLHRFTATQWVYGTLTGRPVDLAGLLQVERGVQAVLPVLVVWCRPDPSVAWSRAMAREDPDVEANIERADELFARYFTRITAYQRILKVDTSRPLSDCVAKVVEELDR